MISGIELTEVNGRLLIEHPAVEAWDIEPTAIYSVASESDDETEYLVVQFEDRGSEWFGCSCPDFEHRQMADTPVESGRCKHIQRVSREARALDDEQQHELGEIL